MEYLAIAVLSCLVGSCSVQNTKAIEGEMPFVQGTPTKELLHEMPSLINQPTDGSGNPVKITVAVYSFPDETGQRKQVGLSTAVSQGADVWVIQSLMAVGNGDWFSVVERASLDNLVKERQLIRSTRELYDGSVATDSLSPMLFAGLILEGGIVGYDTNTTSGGAGARFLGLGANDQYRTDQVTVSLSWDDFKWPRLNRVEVLGHLVSSDASPWPCWHKTEKAMWAAFWGNCVGPCTHGLSVQARCKLSGRSVRPGLSFRNTRWPFTRTLADQENRTQRPMLARFVKIERQPCEELPNFCRRKIRSVGKLARHQGLWGTEHAKRIIDWAEHLQRPHNHKSLASQFFRWHDAEWLQRRRVESGVMRPATRATPGFLPKRWDESLQEARAYLQQYL